MSQQPPIITPEEARIALNDAIRQKLGEAWSDTWDIVSGHDFMMRLTDGTQNMDFYVDLLGQVTIEEKPAEIDRHSGRVSAWLVLGASLFLAYVIARFAGAL